MKHLKSKYVFHGLQSVGTGLLAAACLGMAGCSGLTPAAVSGTSPVTPSTTQSPAAPLGKGGGTGTGIPATTLYQVGPTNTSPVHSVVYQYNLAAGPISPVGSITLPGTFGGYNVTTDLSGQIYVAASDDPVTQYKVYVFPAGSTESATPARTITITDPNRYPQQIAVDSAGLLYVATFLDNNVGNYVNVYSATAGAGSVPIRTLNLSSAVPYSATTMAVDATGNIYILNPNPGPAVVSTVSVFSPTSDGTVPTRTFTIPWQGNGMAVDVSGNVFVNVMGGTNANRYQAVEEFGPTSSGNILPGNTITLSAPTGTLYLGGFVALDGVGNLYTAQSLESLTSPAAKVTYSILQFNQTATGSASPTMTIDPTLYYSGVAFR